MYKIAIGAAVLVLVVGCGGGDDAPATDPYDTYVDNAPAGEPVLSRDDARTRALLGRCEEWPAGSVDAVLADAYAAVTADAPDC